MAEPVKTAYRPKRIEAWELSAGNYENVLAWCESAVQETDATEHTIDIGGICAGPGDYIAQDQNGVFAVYTEDEFLKYHEVVQNEPA